MGWWTADRQRYAVNTLVNGGLSIYGAAALVSRWANVEAAQGPTSVNPTSGAFGIAQWLGSRKSGIYPNPDFDAQLNYVLQELQSGSDGSGGVAWQLLSTAQDANTAATGASAYERAAGSRQLFPRDNYTSRTAAGIPAVLENYGAAASDSGDGTWQPSPDQADLSFAAGAGLPLLAGVVLVLFFIARKLEII